MKHAPSVLIVDDHPGTRMLLRSIVRAEQMTVVGEASSGAKAIEMIRDTPPDVVCLDLVMPEMDGLATLKEVKRIAPHVCVVMVTASLTHEVLTEAREAGVDGFIVKPFKGERLHATITQALDKLRNARRPETPQALV